MGKKMQEKNPAAEAAKEKAQRELAAMEREARKRRTSVALAAMRLQSEGQTLQKLIGKCISEAVKPRPAWQGPRDEGDMADVLPESVQEFLDQLNGLARVQEMADELEERLREARRHAEFGARLPYDEPEGAAEDPDDEDDQAGNLPCADCTLDASTCGQEPETDGCWKASSEAEEKANAAEDAKAAAFGGPDPGPAKPGEIRCCDCEREQILDCRRKRIYSNTDKCPRKAGGSAPAAEALTKCPTDCPHIDTCGSSVPVGSLACKSLRDPEAAERERLAAEAEHAAAHPEPVKGKKGRKS